MKRTINLFKTGALALTVAFALYSCNNNSTNSQNNSNADSTATTDTTNTAAQPASAAPTDPQIASIAVTANQIDVDYADIALQKGTSKEVKDFAATMKRDHSAVIKAATDLATKLNLTPEDNPTTQSLLKLEDSVKQSLNSLSGADFDKAYINNEVNYHKFAINAVQNLLIPNAQNADLKSLLQSALPQFQEHLKHAEMAQAALNK